MPLRTKDVTRVRPRLWPSKRHNVKLIVRNEARRRLPRIKRAFALLNVLVDAEDGTARRELVSNNGAAAKARGGDVYARSRADRVACPRANWRQLAAEANVGPRHDDKVGVDLAEALEVGKALGRSLKAFGPGPNS